MPTIKRTDFMCGVVVISLALYLNMNCAFAFNCQNYIGLPIIDKTIRALGLRQMIQPHDISTEDAFAKTLIEMARPFVDGKARIVFLRYRKGGLGSNAVYDDLLLYKRDIGVFYNGLSRIKMDAGFLHLQFQV